ncbi:MAG: hypothetical protein FWC15_04780 [Fibromonadales bacterium]|nr:hypothetical protein [Fibromonadales bacterium]
MPQFLFTILLLTFAAYAQQKQIAILNTVDDEEPSIKISELNHLTDRLREIAAKNLPQKNYAVMTSQSILSLFPSPEEAIRICDELDGCLVKIGRAITADYIAQGRIGRFGKNYTIKVELYDSEKGILVSSFTGNAKDIYGLLAVLDEKTPDLFKRMLPVSAQVPVLQLPAASGNYIAQIVTEPAGASVLLNGMPYQGCQETPCVISLYENRFRLSVALDDHYTVDTSFVIALPNQLVTVKLKQKMHVVNVTSEPPGASVSFDGITCVTTCPSRFFKRGSVKIKATLDKHEDADTVVFVSDHTDVNLKLKPKVSKK